MAVTAVGGALIGLLQLSTVHDVGTRVGEEMAEMILRMLGFPADESHDDRDVAAPRASLIGRALPGLIAVRRASARW